MVWEFFEEFESWGDIFFGLGAILPEGDFVCFLGLSYFLSCLLIPNLFFGFMFLGDGWGFFVDCRFRWFGCGHSLWALVVPDRLFRDPIIFFFWDVFCV